MPRMSKKYPLTPPDATLPHFKRKKFTAAEVDKLAAVGILSNTSVELIEGDIAEKMPNNSPHAIFSQWAFLVLVQLFGQEYVMANFTLRIDAWSAPDPDVAVMSRPVLDFLRVGRPQAKEVRLLVEVSDEMLSYDLTTKAALYAWANIPEYWVMAVGRRKLIVHRSPTPDGYTDIQEYDETEAIEPLAAPGKPLAIASLMP